MGSDADTENQTAAATLKGARYAQGCVHFPRCLHCARACDTHGWAVSLTFCLIKGRQQTESGETRPDHRA
jgi:hypothetical protein